MISNKHITVISLLLVSLVLGLCIAGMYYSMELSALMGGAAYEMEYEDELFDTSEIISIDIKMNSDKWQEMLDNAMAEEYYECDVIINGTTFKQVGIRPKGNTSLSSIAGDPDNNRYSFKLEFDKFADGQTCFGLDKLILNNNFADATNMKEAIIYDMYNYMGTDASLYNYAEISLNGEYWGVYLALEAVEDSFMLRSFGNENGYLYKPDSMNMGGRDKDSKDNKSRQMGGFGGPGGGGGANLNYSNSNLDSYSTIWEGEVNNSSDADHRRVVTALKNISEGKDVSRYMDIDNLVKYMAVHSFAVNEDSLSGNMAHNYYLYEAGGKLNILPWDYNLSFGGMFSNNPSSMINDPIDTPFSATQFFDPLLEGEYKEAYHSEYTKLIEEYINGGKFEETYNRIRSQIDNLVKTDPNAMYNYEEYEAAVQMLYDVVMLRAESVKGQLQGNIPSTNEGQQADSSALVDASAIDTSVMGTFMGGGFNDRRRD